jgi:hypothetical protein
MKKVRITESQLKGLVRRMIREEMEMEMSKTPRQISKKEAELLVKTLRLFLTAL